MRLVAIAMACLALAPAPARRRDPFTGMLFARLPPGTFAMGTPASEADREAQEALHSVTVAHAFYLAVHEMTQAQWAAVTGTRPSRFRGCAACPVERVSYLDVQRMLARLNAKSRWPGFRLPTEAEWEFACRAGGAAAYGADLTIDRRRANIDGRRTMPVGSFRPNAFGLFDMSGNVWEWTSDDYAPYPGGAAGRGPAFTPERKVIRGGSWRFAADSARCGLRYTHRPQDLGDSLGVRLAHDDK